MVLRCNLWWDGRWLPFQIVSSRCRRSLSLWRAVLALNAASVHSYTTSLHVGCRQRAPRTPEPLGHPGICWRAECVGSTPCLLVNPRTAIGRYEFWKFVEGTLKHRHEREMAKFAISWVWVSWVHLGDDWGDSACYLKDKSSYGCFSFFCSRILRITEVLPKIVSK